MRNFFIALAFLLLFFFSTNSNTLAQSDMPKMEIGAYTTFLRINYNTGPRGFDPAINGKVFTGGGGRLTYNINKIFAVEGALEGFPLDVKNPTQDDIPQPRLQGFLGVKAGVRSEKFGAFFKLRPGFTKYSSTISCGAARTCDETKVTKLSWDIGGVVEGYVSKHFMVRGDIGGTYLRYPSTLYFFPGEPGLPSGVSIKKGLSGFNLQVSAGIGFRF